MSLVCSKCRRLVRDNNVFISNAEYFCPRCKVHYKLSKSFMDNYFHRYESPIDSKILIDKTGETYTINIPNGSEKFTIIHPILFSIIFYWIAYKFYFVDFHSVAILSFLLATFLITLITYSLFGSVLLKVNKSEITIKRTLFRLSHTKKKDFKKLNSVFEFKISNSIDGVKLDFGNSFNGIGFGVDLKDAEKQWLVKELRYMHKELSAKK